MFMLVDEDLCFVKFWVVCFVFLGYVQAISEELLSVTSKSQLQSYKIVAARYKMKVPPSLSS